AAAVAHLDALLPQAAEAALLSCCGSPEWVRRMVARRPFRAPQALLAAAAEEWGRLERAAWLTAFRAHPEIRGGSAEVPAGRVGADWSSQEQAGMRGADAALRARLAAANRAYRERFGYLFLVCATGRTAEEMLALCERRLSNQPERELEVAAAEQL